LRFVAPPAPAPVKTVAPVVERAPAPAPAPAPSIKPAVLPVEPPVPDEPPFPDEPPAFDEPATPDDQPLPDEPSYPDEAPPIEEPYFPGQAPVPSLSANQPAPSAVFPFSAAPFDDPFGAKTQPVAPVSVAGPADVAASGEPQAAATPATPSASAASVTYDGPALWQKVLHHLSDAGQMTLFLFGRTAKAEQTSDHVLDLGFAKNEKVHYDELRSSAAQKILRESLQAITGQVFELHFQIEGAPGTSGSSSSGGSGGSGGSGRSPADHGQGQGQGQLQDQQLGQAATDHAGLAPDGPRQPDWITKLQTTADTFGIPITMED
ncbi:MAG: hypothetical protein H6Q62_151, partial [Firmicutes bacterium]|nr:hypothetical protein [Bacillota bacterium]